MLSHARLDAHKWATERPEEYKKAQGWSGHPPWMGVDMLILILVMVMVVMVMMMMMILSANY